MIVPGNRSGGQWCDSIIVSAKSPYPIVSPDVATRMRSAGRPCPRPTLAVDSPPSSSAPVRSATTAESIAWSKWVCTGTTAANRSMPARASASSIRPRSGATFPSPT